MATALRPPPPKPTGDFEKAYNDAPVKVAAEYWHGTEHHNPMELFATTTIYEGDGKLTIYNKTKVPSTTNFILQMFLVCIIKM